MYSRKDILYEKRQLNTKNIFFFLYFCHESDWVGAPVNLLPFFEIHDPTQLNLSWTIHIPWRHHFLKPNTRFESKFAVG